MNPHVFRASTLITLFAAGCAAPVSPPPATPAAAAPVAAAAPPAAPPLPAPGELASSDAPTFTAACQRLLADGRAGMTRLKATPRPVPRAATDGVLQVYDEARGAIFAAAEVAELVFNAHPDAAMRDAAQKCGQAADAADTEVTLDRGVYDVLAGLDLSTSDGATRFWIGETLGDFRRAGVNRDPETRKKIAALQDQVTVLGQQFDNNINSDTRTAALMPADLEGLPADWLAKHKPGADGKITVTTQYPDYFPIMTFAKREATREKMYRLFRQRAYPANMETLPKLLAARHELATVLGYPTFAAFSMENKMIRTPQAAHDFIDQIVKASTHRLDADYKLLLARWKKEQPKAKEIPAWDASWVGERVRNEQLDFDAQSVRPYFEFSHVQAGLLDVTSRLFGIEYRRVADARVWHPEVEVYDVFDGGKKLGRIYLDLHPRAGKFSHAAQFTLADGKEGVRLPAGALLCNFPRAGERMDHGDVRTFFHEFGHLLHHVFAGHTRWNGTANLRERDFVEAPSQLLEEWVDDPTVLQTFAVHDQTKQPIPTELVQRMKTAEEFGRGIGVRRQMVFASLSLALYDRDPAGIDTSKLMAGFEGGLTPYKHVDGTYEQAAFGHLSGYASNYYTYMWSLVIAKDLFTPFKQAGLLDRATATRYRKAVLEAGGSKPAAEMVRDFLGRPFTFDAYAKWLDEEPAKTN